MQGISSQTGGKEGRQMATASQNELWQFNLHPYIYVH